MDPRDKAAREAKRRQKEELLDRAYSRVIESQLHKIGEAKKKIITEDDEERYRLTLAKEREIALSSSDKGKKGSISAKHEELARKTGLSGTVVALMVAEEEASDDCEGSSGREKKTKKKKKHRKRKETKSDRKKEKRKKRSRKMKKGKRKRSYSSGSSGSDSGSDGSSANQRCSDSEDDEDGRRKSKKKRKR